MSELDALTEKLGKTSIPKEEGVSFAGKGLAWNNAEDAKEVVDKINACPNMEYLNLEGNTLGVEAAEAISKALEDKSRMRKALWKDMFTGRKKNEIPVALKHLCRGLMKANAKLEVLDLSDNASGPIGVEGIVDLIRSPTCFSLKELKLNNMGLGITGAKILAKALNDCYNTSTAAGTPLALTTFIAGRNRLENEGSTALAKVFEKMGSLVVFQTPQNGIYLPGISALARAFANNPNLQEINLNDNTLNPEGSLVLSESLSKLKGLVKLDLGDCLIKSKGALHLAEALESGLNKLEEVVVSFNSIKAPEGLAIFEAVLKLENFKTLHIDGNNFGLDGIEQLRRVAEKAGKESALGSLSEDEGSEDESSDDEANGDEDEDECSEEYSGDGGHRSWSGTEDGDYDQKDEDYSEGTPENEEDNIIQSGYSSRPKTGSAKGFLQNPTESNFNKLGDTAVSSIIQEIQVVQDSHLPKLNEVANSHKSNGEPSKSSKSNEEPHNLSKTNGEPLKPSKSNEEPAKSPKINGGCMKPELNRLSSSSSKTEKKRVSFSSMFSSLTLSEKSPSLNEDACELVARLVATKLRQMNGSTSLLAERLINQVLYEGLIGNLNPDSVLVLNPHQHKS